MQKKYLGAVLILIFFVVAGYFATQKKSDLPTISCPDLSKVCSVTAGLNISTDHPPQIMRPFRLLINASEMTPISASFAMQGMDMGLNRYRLIKQGNGWFVFRGAVHGCWSWRWKCAVNSSVIMWLLTAVNCCWL